MPNNPFTLALVAAILAPALSSVAWVTEQQAVLRLPVLVVGGCSPLIAGLILVLYARCRFGRAALSVPQSSWGLILFISILRNGIGFFFFLTALSVTSSIKIMFLTKMEPYLVLFIQWLRGGATLSRQQGWLLSIHVVGAVVLSTGGAISFGLDQVGDLCVVAGLLANALVYQPAQELGAKIGSTQASAWTQIIPGIVLTPVALCLYPAAFDWGISEVCQGWWYLLVTVVLFYVLSTSLWFYSLQGLPGWLCSALRSVGPIVAAPLAWILYDQGLSSLQLCGAGVVLLTSFLMIRERGSGGPRRAHSTTSS